MNLLNGQAVIEAAEALVEQWKQDGIETDDLWPWEKRLVEAVEGARDGD